MGSSRPSISSFAAALGVSALVFYLAAYTPWIVNASKTYIHLTDCKNDQDCSLSISNRIGLSNLLRAG